MIETKQELKVKSTFLFDNGMIITFDKYENQIPELQGEYSEELHKKITERSEPTTVWTGFAPFDLKNE